MTVYVKIVRGVRVGDDSERFGRGARNGKDGNEGTASANALAFTDQLQRTIYYEIKLRKQIYIVQYQIRVVRRLGGTAAARRVRRA